MGGGGGSVFCDSLFPGLRLNFYGHMILNASGWASWKTQILDLRSLSPKRTVAQEFLGPDERLATWDEADDFSTAWLPDWEGKAFSTPSGGKLLSQLS